MIILVGGKAGEGKTTFANFCIEYLNGDAPSSEIIPFAKKVKDTARFMGWDGEKDASGRTLLQDIGRAGRAYDPNIWAKNVADAIIASEHDIVFVDDWRFPNELRLMNESFDAENVISVRIRRQEQYHLLLGTPMYNDISETSLPDDDDYYDVVIPNYDGLPELREKAVEFVDEYIRRS